VPIRVRCPSCGRTGRVPEQAIGLAVVCPACSHSHVLTTEMIVPGEPERGADKPAPATRPAAVESPRRPAPAAPPTTASRPAAASRSGSTDGGYDVAEAPIVYPTRAAKLVPAAASQDDDVDASAGGIVLSLPVLAGGAIGIAFLVGVTAWVAVSLSRGRANAGDEVAAATNASSNAPAFVATPTPPPIGRQGSSETPSPAGDADSAKNGGDPARTAASSITGGQPASASRPSQSPDSGMVSAADAAGLMADEPPDPAGDSEIAAKARAGAVAAATRDDGAGRSLSTAEIVAESEPSVALIKGKGSSGTGFIVAPGLVATNAHVIDDEFITDLEVRFVSADERHSAPLKAELLYEDADRDLAFLAVKTDLKPLRIAKTYTFRKGEDITVIGNPGMGDGQVLENAISRGVMSTKTRLDNKDFYQLGIAINPGNSGGPVFDSAGRVIGVATRKSMKQEAMGFSIPIEDLHAALAKIAKQSSADANKYRSRHRVNNAVKGLGGGGALMCLLIDLRRAAAQSDNAQVKELLDKLEPVAAEMDKEMFPSLTTQAPRIKSDRLVSSTVKDKVDDMAENFTRIRTAFSGRRSIDDNQLRSWKQTHKRLITELSASLKLEVPEGLLAVFDDQVPAQRTMIITMSPSSLGSYGSRLRQRPGIGAPGAPRTPGMITRPPSLRDRRRGIR
jgi:S1-C subfamily serine protease